MNETLKTDEFTTALSTPRKRKKNEKNLWKRNGVWQFTRMVKGKRNTVSLGTIDIVLARAKRDALLKAETEEERARVLGHRRNAATLAQIFQIYREAPMIRANSRTRTSNIANLVRMVRMIKGSSCDVETLRCTDLTAELVEAWQLRRLEQARIAAAGNLAALESSKRSANSLLTTIQSIFSKQALYAYRRLNLPPNIRDFAEAPGLPARKQEEPVQLSDQVVLQLIEAGQSLLSAQPAIWAALQLMTWGGLRNTEACHARRSWLKKDLMGYRLSLKPAGDFVPKGNSREVIIPAEVAVALLSLPSLGVDPLTFKPDDHLVPAENASQRHFACYRGLNDWLKSQGIAYEAGKISYRLRKYFLKKVAVQQHPLMAQAAGGHSSISTTQDHYIGKPKMMEPIRMPVDLAKMLSFRIDQIPQGSSLPVGTIFNLQQAAALLEVNAGDLAARAEKAESVTLDGFVLTVRRDGLNGALVPAPVA